MKNAPLVESIKTRLECNKWDDADSLALAFPQFSKRQLLRSIAQLTGEVISSLDQVTNDEGKRLNERVLRDFKLWLGRKRFKTMIVQRVQNQLLVLSDLRGHVKFTKLKTFSSETISAALNMIAEDLKLIPHGEVCPLLYQTTLNENLEVIDSLHDPPKFIPIATGKTSPGVEHLRELEQESIHIIREAVASADNPAMLFSLGKDSMTMLRLAEKAFAPEKIPFPLVNIDTRWKFREMNSFREWVKARSDVETIHYINPDAIKINSSPFEHGSASHTFVTKTQALLNVVNENGYDFLFGGARRDEEKSRAKERIFSVRDSNHSWDPKNQRPELWDDYNTALVNAQSMRVFPLSNWTEKDVWCYIEQENIPLVPLYFAKRRPFVERNGALIMVDDERFALEPGEKIFYDFIRFRSLGCYPLSGGFLSKARTVAEIISELEESNVSERASRVIDFDRGASMEQKKKEGYF